MWVVYSRGLKVKPAEVDEFVSKLLKSNKFEQLLEKVAEKAAEKVSIIQNGVIPPHEVHHKNHPEFRLNEEEVTKTSVKNKKHGHKQTTHDPKSTHKNRHSKTKTTFMTTPIKVYQAETPKINDKITRNFPREPRDNGQDVTKETREKHNNENITKKKVNTDENQYSSESDEDGEEQPINFNVTSISHTLTSSNTKGKSTSSTTHTYATEADDKESAESAKSQIEDEVRTSKYLSKHNHTRKMKKVVDLNAEDETMSSSDESVEQLEKEQQLQSQISKTLMDQDIYERTQDSEQIRRLKSDLIESNESESADTDAEDIMPIEEDANQIKGKPHYLTIETGGSISTGELM